MFGIQCSLVVVTNLHTPVPLFRSSIRLTGSWSELTGFVLEVFVRMIIGSKPPGRYYDGNSTQTGRLTFQTQKTFRVPDVGTGRGGRGVATGGGGGSRRRRYQEIWRRPGTADATRTTIGATDKSLPPRSRTETMWWGDIMVSISHQEIISLAMTRGIMRLWHCDMALLRIGDYSADMESDKGGQKGDIIQALGHLKHN